MSNLPLPVQSHLIRILNYHDSGYTNSSLHRQSSRAHELARPHLVTFSEKLWQLATETGQFCSCNR